MAKAKLGYGRGTGLPSPVDVHVGARLRQRRTLLGMSQTKLGEAIGLAFQQVQKYERGANRISASRLYALSGTLDVPIEYFLSDMPTAVAASSPTLGGGRAKTLELVRAYYKIEDADVRKRLRELMGAAVSKDS